MYEAVVKIRYTVIVGIVYYWTALKVGDTVYVEKTK